LLVIYVEQDHASLIPKLFPSRKVQPEHEAKLETFLLACTVIPRVIEHYIWERGSVR